MGTLLGSHAHERWQKRCPKILHYILEMVWNRDRVVRECNVSTKHILWIPLRSHSITSIKDNLNEGKNVTLGGSSFEEKLHFVLKFSVLKNYTSVLRINTLRSLPLECGCSWKEVQRAGGWQTRNWNSLDITDHSYRSLIGNGLQ